MKNKIIIISAFFILFLLPACTNLKNTSPSEDPGKNLIPYADFDSENEQIWGYLDEDTGEIIINAKYDFAGPFVGNFAEVYDSSIHDSRKNNTLIIDKKGKTVSLPAFHKVYLITSENENCSLAILERKMKRTKFQIGTTMLGVTTDTGFYDETYYKYRLINLKNGKTIIPEKENYLTRHIEVAGDYFIVDTNLYQFLDNGNVELVVKDDSEQAARILREYFNGRGINAEVKPGFTGIEIDYFPYIKAKHADPDLSGAFKDFNPDFNIPFYKADPFIRNHRVLLNASLEINERKYFMQFRDNKNGERRAEGIYNETKKEWEVMPYAFNTDNQKIYYVYDILPLNDPHLFRLRFKTDELWKDNRYILIGAGIYSNSKDDFMLNYNLGDGNPGRSFYDEKMRNPYKGYSFADKGYSFADKGIWYRDISRMRNPQFSHSKDIAFVKFNPDGKTIISISRGIMKIWDAESGKLLRQFNEIINFAGFSPDGRIIVVKSWRDKVQFFEADSGRLVKTLDDMESENIVLAPDGKTFVLLIENRSEDRSDNTGSIEIRDSGSGELIKRIDELYKWLNKDLVSFSTDSNFIIVGFNTGQTKIFNAKNGELINTIKSVGQLSIVRLSPDNKIIAAGLYSGSIKFLNMKGEIIRSIGGHAEDPSNFFKFEFSLDGKMLVSGGMDGKIKIWDSASGRLIRTISGNLGSIRTVSLSPDGRFIVSGGDARRVQLWDAQTGELIRTFIDPDMKIDY